MPEMHDDHWLLVNRHQLQADRKQKYLVVRMYGKSSYEAIRMRDWRWRSLSHVLGFNLGLVKEALDPRFIPEHPLGRFADQLEE